MGGFARLACLGIIVSLTTFLGYALATAPIMEQVLGTWGFTWGRYVWADAYAGFVLTAILVYSYERRLGLTLLIFFATCWTGNMVTAAWLLWRGPDICRRFAAGREMRLIGPEMETVATAETNQTAAAMSPT